MEYPAVRNIWVSHWAWIALNALFISSCKSDAIPPFRRAFMAIFTIIRMAKSVNLSRLLPIWLSGRSCFAFATLIISRAKAALIILPTALN
jgi:hypothetical protein